MSPEYLINVSGHKKWRGDMVGVESWYGGGGVMIWWGWSHDMVGVES